MLQIGDKLSRYTIVARIGSGAMGEVFRARDDRLGREVALKILPHHLHDTQEAVDRFTREASAASALNHPNVVTIYEIGEGDGVRFIAMEFVEGATVRSLVAKRLDAISLAKLGIQMARALKVTHAKGIMHRDIKPENIIVRPDGIIKVLDFGLAKQGHALESLSDPKLAEMTSPGVVIGTARYMSPEQARGDKVGSASDIFSLGMVLYELAAGRHPFASDFPMEVLRGIMSDPAPPLSSRRNDLPPKLDSLIAQMMEKAPEARPSAEEAERELEEVAAGSAGAAPPMAESQNGAAGQRPPPKPSREAEPALPAAPITRPQPASGRQRRPSPAAILALGLTALVAAFIYHIFRQAPGTTPRSIAVVPFANVRGDANIEYLSDGLTESIIGSLSQLPTLKVLARSTVFRFKGKDIDPRLIGRELNADAVLTGRVVKDGQNLAVSAELVKAGDGTRLWGGEYNRTMSDLVATKQDIANEIASALSARLASPRRPAAGHDTSDSEAYRLYLEGRYFWNKRTASSLRKSIEIFQKAIDRDPNYALAYSGLADSCALLPQYSGAASDDWLAKAEAAAKRAIQMDEAMAEPHATLGLIAQTRYEWAAAEREFKRALELDPNYATAHQWYARVLQDQRRWDEALVQLKKAEEIDPLSLIIILNLSEFYACTGQTDLAAREADKARDLDSSFHSRFPEIGILYLRQHRDAEAIAFMEKAVEQVGRTCGSLSYLAYAYARTGQADRARPLLKELQKGYDENKATGEDLAFAFFGLGEIDRTFEWLSKAVDAHDLMPSTLYLEEYASLRADSRYSALLARMGVKPL